MNLIEEVKKNRIIPVLVLNEVTRAQRIGEILVENKLPIVELTLRTEKAFDILEVLAGISGLTVGVGSVQTTTQLVRAREIGASFAVSAGLSLHVAAQAKKLKLDYLPGVSTPTEILMALDAGIQTVKWFPAEALGGIPTLQAVSAPFPNVSFVPTGGITFESSKDYLVLKAVLGVGGSWMFAKTDDDTEFYSALEKSVRRISPEVFE